MHDLAALRRPVRFRASIAVLAVIMPTAAVAQSANANRSDDALGEIIVTASGRAQSAESIPYNVNALGEKTLREQNVVDLKRLIELIPSVNAPGNSARFADSVTVRGLNISPVNANNLESFTRTTIAYYLNDTPLPNIGYRIKDVARVETLLGPQGTLYGGGSLGGTIRFITNQPAFDRVAGRVSTSIYAAQGGALSHDTDAVLNVPITSTLAIRGSIARLDDGGYTDRISNPFWRQGALAWTTIPNPNLNRYRNDDYTRTTTGRLALAWQPTSRARLTLAYSGQRQFAHGTSATTLLPLAIANAHSPADYDSYVRDPNFSPCATDCRFTDPYATPPLAGIDVTATRYPEFARRNFDLGSADLNWDLGFADLHSSTSYFKDSRIGQADYAGPGWTFYFALGDAGGAFDSGRSAYVTFNNSYSGWNHETRLTSKGTGPFSYIVGLYFTDTRRSFQFSENLPGLDAYIGLDRVAAGGNIDEGYRDNLEDTYREIAGYGELTYAITPRWKLTGGARVFWYRSRAIILNRDYTFDLVNSSVDVTRSENAKSIFKANTSFDLTSDALVYATVSQGFRRGGTNGFKNFQGNTVSEQLQAYQPDTTTNYEVGFKGFFNDRRLYVQADVFQINWSNVQTYFAQTVDNGFPVNGTANGPNARSRGFEGLVRFQPVDGLTLNFATAYTEAEWSSTRTVCLYTNSTGCRTWSKGGQLGGAPRWKHNGEIRYQKQLSEAASGFVSIVGRYVGSVPIDRADDPNTVVDAFPAYALADVRLGYTWNNIDTSLWVENIANRRAKVSQQYDRVMGPRVFYTQPRTFGINASYRF